MQVGEVLDFLECRAPLGLAASWDNVGLLLGSPREPLKGIMVALDATRPVIQQACAVGANLIVTHHPVIFRPLSAIRTDTAGGVCIEMALQQRMAIISLHTNLDAAVEGVSAVLAADLELVDITPLVPEDEVAGSTGLGRMGTLASPLTSDALIERLRQVWRPPWLLEAGRRPDRISRVAVCGGACSEYAEIAYGAGCDVLITAEVKHAVARWAEESAFWLIDAGHFTTENRAMPVLADWLRQWPLLQKAGIGVEMASQEGPLRLVSDSHTHARPCVPTSRQGSPWPEG